MTGQEDERLAVADVDGRDLRVDRLAGDDVGALVGAPPCHGTAKQYAGMKSSP